MFVKPRFVQFLTSVSVAAMFVATPLAVKFDGEVGLAIVATAAFAQAIPDDIPGGPIEPPTDCVDACGPPTDPVDPPTEPVDPPTEPVDPPTEPVDPPIDPIDPPIDICDQKGAPDKCFDPEPVAVPYTPDGDDEPADLPVVDIPAGGTPKQNGLDFVETVRCQTACTASVTEDGEVTVTVTSTTTGGDTVETKLTQAGPDVETTIVVNNKILATADENFESEDEARDVVAERTEDIPEEVKATLVTLTLNADFPEETYDEEEQSPAEIVDAFLSAMSDVLDIPVDRFQVTAITEG